MPHFSLPCPLALWAAAAAFSGGTACADDAKILRHELYACVPDSPAAGLRWQDGRWESTRFRVPDKFTLEVMVIKDSEPIPFIHMTRKDSEGEHHCGGVQNLTDNLFGVDSCSSSGETIVFSKKPMRGGVSNLLGSTSSSATERDSLAVMPFSCQAF